MCSSTSHLQCMLSVTALTIRVGCKKRCLVQGRRNSKLDARSAFFKRMGKGQQERLIHLAS